MPALVVMRAETADEARKGGSTLKRRMVNEAMDLSVVGVTGG